MPNPVINTIKENKLKTCFLLFLLLSSTILDRLLKILFLNQDDDKPVLYFFGKLFGVGHFFNQKGAFSLPFKGTLFLGTIFIFIVILSVLLFTFTKNLEIRKAFFTALILSGALSNFYDRLRYDFVIDYFHVANISVFNIADFLILIGVGLFIVDIFKKTSK